MKKNYKNLPDGSRNGPWFLLSGASGRSMTNVCTAIDFTSIPFFFTGFDIICDREYTNIEICGAFDYRIRISVLLVLILFADSNGGGALHCHEFPRSPNFCICQKFISDNHQINHCISKNDKLKYSKNGQFNSNKKYYVFVYRNNFR